MKDNMTIVLIVDMSCRQTVKFEHLKAQVTRFLDALPPGWRGRLVGYGIRSSSDGDYMSVQSYVSTTEAVMRQFREVGNVPFSAKAGNPDCAWGWLAKMDAELSSGVQVIWFASPPERIGVKRRNVKILPFSATTDEIACAVGLEAGISLEPKVVSLKSDSGRNMTLRPRCPSSFGNPEREFNDMLVSAVRAFKQEIDVLKFVQPQRLGGYGWTPKRVHEMYYDVLWNNPQLFYVNKVWEGSFYVNGYGRIVSGQLRIPASTYAIKPDQYEKCKRELDEAADRALATVSGIDDEVEVVKRLHDYIVNTCEYDEEARAAGGRTPRARTAYDVLVRHSAVCEGYVMGYRYLLSLAGIVSEEVLSDEMAHCWSYVRIGENWYHVDVTHDDPTYKGRQPPAGYVSHKFFLLSDAAIKAKGHCGWTVRDLPPALDKRFDNRKWNPFIGGVDPSFRRGDRLPGMLEE